jgi:hypothetical protein
MIKRGLTVPLTKGWPRVCVGLVKGFNRVHRQGFRGDDPGWPRFDRCSAGLTRLIRSLALIILIKNLGRHNPYETSETRRTHTCNMHKSCRTPWMSPRRRDCLPASSSHPLLLSAEGAAGASRRRELRARAPPPPPHIKKKGRRRPWAAAAHPGVGGARRGASDRGGAHHHQRRAHRRPSLPVEELCLPEKKKRKREKWWAVDSFFRSGERRVRFFLLPPDVRVQALPNIIWYYRTKYTTNTEWSISRATVNSEHHRGLRVKFFSERKLPQTPLCHSPLTRPIHSYNLRSPRRPDSEPRREASPTWRQPAAPHRRQWMRRPGARATC